jgi:hypothetical protein
MHRNHHEPTEANMKGCIVASLSKPTNAPLETEAGNVSNDICRVIDTSRSPSPDSGRSPKFEAPSR